jgi:UDP-N-acetylglucosamine diphosphorylase / glucose-1-phosphate thymidylyltransferase / UDP-N-acetylgalactosamine diphosphorylase / glucosamine-1-phosphate N-acetyltransferase / galactosamine-1-phosphate N-acetyltransferase
MEICIYEDNKAGNLAPLSLARPVYDLVCGMTMLRKKIERMFEGTRISLHTRPYLHDYTTLRSPKYIVNKVGSSDACVFINGRVMLPVNFKKIIRFDSPEDIVFVCKGQVVGAKVSGKNLERIKTKISDVLTLETFEGIKAEEIDVQFYEYPWDFIRYHAGEMYRDYAQLFAGIPDKRIHAEIGAGVHLVNEKDIFIDEGAIIKPGVVIDASSGPIVIGKNSVVESNAVIQGPVYIGRSSRIRPLSVIYDNTSIGNVCKVGGEVEFSIIQSYSNKQHQGFLGHAYLGSWVNIGADTNCSDLKNNYSTVRAQIDAREVDTALQFLGIIMGDHCKTGINTMFNTGTVVGFSSNVFGAEFPPKYIPSFAWGNKATYNVSLSITTAKKVMLRRNQMMLDCEEKLFKHIFEITKSEREQRGFKS